MTLETRSKLIENNFYIGEGEENGKEREKGKGYYPLIFSTSMSE